MKSIFRRKCGGDIIISVLVFAAISIVVIIGLVNWGAMMLKSVRTIAAKEQAFQIAEAGVDYYQWHLAKNPGDFMDGTSGPPPYIHDFFDKNGVKLGTFSLDIVPPNIGSTVVKVISTGTMASSTISRKVEKVFAIPSLAKYAVVANDNMRFGEGTEVFGPIHSNKGIRFDGISHNLVSSALSEYNDTDSDDCNGGSSFAVHTCADPDDPSPPQGVPDRPDVFMAGRQFPVPSIDFDGLMLGLTQLQTLARNGGKEWAPSGDEGYHLVFKVVGNVTSYDMYKVNRLELTPNSCGKDSTAKQQVQWGMWTIRSPISSNQTLVGNYPIPDNGIIFVNDNLWIDGRINNARVTVVAGVVGNTDPENNANITINSDLTYANYDGQDVIGLISQGNINIGLVSEEDIRIDAALLAAKGRVGRYYYNNHCKISSVSHTHKDSVTLFGMIATNIRYGFAYTDGSGYALRNIIYDSNLLYSPPPYFPAASGQYQVISWREL